MYLWPEEFKDNPHPNGTIQDLVILLDEVPFTVNGDLLLYRDRLRSSDGVHEDKKWWMLTRNGAFMVKPFYNFLNDEGLRCPATKFFWRKMCKKKSIFSIGLCGRIKLTLS